MPLGGTFQAYSLFEIEQPIVKEAGLKLVIFYDIGNSWDPVSRARIISSFVPTGASVFAGSLRSDRCASSGVSRSISKPTEDSPVFNFFIGPPF